MTVFADYAKYYDLLYKDKDYEGEARYIQSLIEKYHRNATDVLDLGCGTGRHAQLLARAGYQVHGVDLSAAMLERARERIHDGIKLSFSQGNVQDVDLGKKFDVVTSMFHVMSYQTTNDELLKAFHTAQKHLKEDGIFIFDCWYGPAVLTDRPEVRVKRLADDEVEITRIAEPVMHVNENCVDVNYHVFVKDKSSQGVCEINECHRMRYWFMPEITNLLLHINMKLVASGEWLTNKQPSHNTWNVYFVVKWKN